MSRDRPSVLVVGPEDQATRTLVAFLRDHDLSVVWARDGESAFHALDEERFDCLVAELEAPRVDGLDVLRRARDGNRDLCAVLLADAGRVQKALAAMAHGAHDFQVKPPNLEKLLAVLRLGVSHQKVAARAAALERRLEERLGTGPLTGRSRAIVRVGEQIRHLSSTRAPVLIEGERGAGKGRVARLIHESSPRKAQPFVWVDLGLLEASLVEGELFGDGRGAHPGSRHRGRFELADGGTLFLDEIGRAGPSVQVKLLQTLQDREIERVGERKRVKVDVRVLSATSLDLEAEVEAGRFREDLLRQLGVRIKIPPLRDRREDIPLLVETFLRELGQERGRRITGITRGVLERLVRHSWPANVRELREVVEQMIHGSQAKRPLDLSDLPAFLRDETGAPEETIPLQVGMTVAEAERQLVEATLQHTGYDKASAAAILGIGLRTLYRKIRQYGLGRPPGPGGPKRPRPTGS